MKDPTFLTELKLRISCLKTFQLKEARLLSEQSRSQGSGGIRRTRSASTRTQSIRRTSLREKTMTTKRDVQEEKMHFMQKFDQSDKQQARQQQPHTNGGQPSSSSNKYHYNNNNHHGGDMSPGGDPSRCAHYTHSNFLFQNFCLPPPEGQEEVNLLAILVLGIVSFFFH